MMDFRFSLTNGSLYAFWVSRDESGRSDGYVAGGRPGYPGTADTVATGGPISRHAALRAARLDTRNDATRKNPGKILGNLQISSGTGN